MDCDNEIKDLFEKFAGRDDFQPKNSIQIGGEQNYGYFI